jgi:hypothetical protein
MYFLSTQYDVSTHRHHWIFYSTKDFTRKIKARG